MNERSLKRFWIVGKRDLTGSKPNIGLGGKQGEKNRKKEEGCRGKHRGNRPGRGAGYCGGGTERGKENSGGTWGRGGGKINAARRGEGGGQ